MSDRVKFTADYDLNAQVFPILHGCLYLLSGKLRALVVCEFCLEGLERTHSGI